MNWQDTNCRYEVKVFLAFIDKIQYINDINNIVKRKGRTILTNAIGN